MCWSVDKADRGTNKNTGRPAESEFQMNHEFFKYKYVPCNVWDILVLKKMFPCPFEILQFNKASCILFGKLTCSQGNPSMHFLSLFLLSSIRNTDMGRETLKASWRSFWGGYIHALGIRQDLSQIPCLTLPT